MKLSSGDTDKQIISQLKGDGMIFQVKKSMLADMSVVKWMNMNDSQPSMAMEKRRSECIRSIFLSGRVANNLSLA